MKLTVVFHGNLKNVPVFRKHLLSAIVQVLDFGEEMKFDVWRLTRFGGTMEMGVPEKPERVIMFMDQKSHAFPQVLGLMFVGWQLAGNEILVLELNPGVMEEPEEEGVRAKSLLRNE